MDFAGRHVVITGGTGALGSAVVGALLEAGAHCHVPYIAEREAERFAHKGGPLGERVTLYPGVELTDESKVEKLYAGIAPLWASIHLAGGFAMQPLAEASKADVTSQIEMNLVSAFLCCRAAVVGMKKAGGGRIVNVAARPALEPRTGSGMTAYTASKAGVAALTAALAEEVAKDAILVNAVAPSIMDTPANRSAMPKANFDAWPKVDEVAATILFLASPENKVTRGAIVPVYGKS